MHAGVRKSALTYAPTDSGKKSGTKAIPLDLLVGRRTIFHVAGQSVMLQEVITLKMNINNTNGYTQYNTIVFLSVCPCLLNSEIVSIAEVHSRYS